MSKIKKSELLDIVREQGSAITNLLQRVTFLENPHLKHLDQSIFDGLDEKWRFAAVDSDGSRAVFTSDNITQNYGKHYVNALSGEVKQILGRVDASNWQNSLIERDTAELLEVDLSSELTGSDLTKSILSKKFMQACLVSDSSDKDALQGVDLQLIRMYNETNGKFISM